MIQLYNEIMKYFVLPSGRLTILGKLGKILLILILAKLASEIISRFIDSSLKYRKGEDNSLAQRRAHTVGNTVKRVVEVLIYFYCILIGLETFNIDTKSILATAGVGGIAIGFGAQSLVKDVITGFFILQDNIYVVGDYVKIKGYEGRVERLGLRVTSIRSLSGDLHIIPNGEVQIISNLSRGGVRALVWASIAYEEDLDRAINVLQKVCDRVNKDYHKVIYTESRIRGVDRLTDVGVDIRIEAMVRAVDHYDVERALRKGIKEELERHGIEIPYPRLVVYGREE